MPAVLELIQELATFEKEPHAVVVTVQDLINDGFGATPLFYSFVAVQDNTIVGMALYYYRYSTWKGCRLYLEDFIVTEEFRGKGVGKKLFEQVILEAKSHHYNGMVWQVLDWNEPAINFYNKYKAQLESGWLNAAFSTEQVKAF